MYKPDRATQERNAKSLRELVKRPENKVCADCKRNDPRWASWNLGVFLCIRCSGIHRGMGTHISKVKSVDLDAWTPEQMENIQKWGNHLANLYWEAHLKAGHIPPEHKMESFIRSKYESRRWAMEGPVPTDPSILDGGASAAPPEAPPVEAIPPPTHNKSSSISRRSQVTNTQPQPHKLLSVSQSNQRQAPAQAAPAPAPAPPQPPAPENDLFSLDFHAPASSAPATSNTSQPPKNVKNDILSLFSTPSAAPAAPAGNFGQFVGAQVPQQASPWGNAQVAQQPWGNAQVAQQQQQQQAGGWGHVQQAPVQSMVGNTGAGHWGASSGWNAPANSAGNVWAGAPQQGGGDLFASGNDIWGGSSAGTNQSLFGGGAGGAATAPKKDDAFGDIWGGFK